MDGPIDCPRCVLRLLAEADLAAFAEYRSDPAIARFQSWSTPYSLDQAKELLASAQKAAFGEPDTWQQIAILDRESGSLMGDCAVHFLSDGQQVEVGFTLAKSFQGRGIAQEAMTGLLNYLLRTMRIHRMIALTDVRNEASVRLLVRLGFRKEGHFLQGSFYKGEWCDEFLFACLAAEWSNGSLDRSK